MATSLRSGGGCQASSICATDAGRWQWRTSTADWRDYLQWMGQSPFAISVLPEMLFAGRDNALAHAFSHVGILLEIPSFTDGHRERQPAFKIPIVLEMLLGRADRAFGNRQRYVLILFEIPRLIHLDTRNHHTYNSYKIIIQDTDAQFTSDRRYLDETPDQIERRKVVHGGSRWTEARSLQMSIAWMNL